MPNKFIIHRVIDGMEIYGTAIYDESRDVWKCTVTDHLGGKDVRETSDALAELGDMIELAIATSRAKLAA